MKYIEYICLQADNKRIAGKCKTSQNYIIAARSFERYLKSYYKRSDIDLSEINSDMISDYEHFLLCDNRISRNTSSAYIRSLRAVYRMAIQNELCCDSSPFSNVYTGIDRTRKRTLDDNSLKLILSLDLDEEPLLLRARDIFYFSFLAQGMPFVDLTRLRYAEINTNENYFRYCRSKSKETVSVMISSKMKDVVKKYHNKGDVYAFSLGIDPYNQKEYSNELHRYNIHLRRIAAMAGIKSGLSSYCARHSWASQAYRLNIPVSVISCCMGHTSENTTRIYLSSLAESELHASVSILNRVYEPLWINK